MTWLSLGNHLNLVLLPGSTESPNFSIIMSVPVHALSFTQLLATFQQYQDRGHQKWDSDIVPMWGFETGPLV